jgi:phage major head subunit gpT-like protein
MQINQSAIAALYKGYKTLFLEAFHGAKPLWDQLAMRAPSTAGEEKYHWLGAVPGMKEIIGEIAIRNLTAHDYAIKNKEYESTVGVKQADIERDTYGVYNPLMQALGLASAEHPDELIFNLLINGFSTTCYTGKNFFDADHAPKANGTKFSNKGTKKLSAGNFETARANIKGRLNAEGRPMNLGRDLVLLVSPKNESLGRSILQADFVEGSTASKTVSNVNKGTARLLVCPRLAASEDAWFLIDVGYPVKPLIVQVEKAPDLVSVNKPDDSYVVLNHEFLFQAYARHGAGYGLPELAYGSTGADAA